MSRKTVSMSGDAYDDLDAEKRDDESFTDVVIRLCDYDTTEPAPESDMEPESDATDDSRDFAPSPSNPDVDSESPVAAVDGVSAEEFERMEARVDALVTKIGDLESGVRDVSARLDSLPDKFARKLREMSGR